MSSQNKKVEQATREIAICHYVMSADIFSVQIPVFSECIKVSEEFGEVGNNVFSYESANCSVLCVCHTTCLIHSNESIKPCHRIPSAYISDHFHTGERMLSPELCR